MSGNGVIRLKAAAYHEAGHAVTRCVSGLPVTAVHINTDGTGLSHGTGKVVRTSAQLYLAYTLAGAIAEARAVRRSLMSIYFTTAREDLDEASAFIKRTSTERGLSEDEAWRDAEQCAKSLVRCMWPAIEAVASHLLQRRKLEADEVSRLVHQAMAGTVPEKRSLELEVAA